VGKLYADLNHLATLNIEALFDRWGLKWKWIDNDNIAFLNPLRSDASFGSCSFNVRKKIGKDFAAPNISDGLECAMDYGLDIHDLSRGLGDGWDLVGLARILFRCNTLTEAANIIVTDLAYISRGQKLFALSEEIKQKREEELALQRLQKKEFSCNWSNKSRGALDSVVERYLLMRSIRPVDPVVRFHHAMKYTEDGGKTGVFYPVMILPIRHQPDGEIEGVHVTYIKPDGSGKADVKSPKKVHGAQKGNAIWFGTPCENLAVGEGPESTLSLPVLGYETFAACAINANNLPEIIIPSYVKRVTVYPDNDDAGQAAARRFKQKHKSAVIRNPPAEYKDWNDYLRNTNGGRSD
jgi:hypothetical protein